MTQMLKLGNPATIKRSGKEGASMFKPACRRMLITMSVLAVAGLTAPPSSAQIHEYWRVNYTASCDAIPRSLDGLKRPLPGGNEVLLFDGEDFSGACVALDPGLYPHPENLLIANDSIRSVRVGGLVIAILFDDVLYASKPVVVTSDVPKLSSKGLDRAISSARVEPRGLRNTADSEPGLTCVLQANAITLFSDNKDCITMPALPLLPGSSFVRRYNKIPTAEDLAVKNDHINRIDASQLDPTCALAVFKDKLYSSDEKVLQGGVDYRSALPGGITSIMITDWSSALQCRVK
jgi:hypothetical protein